jgi:hypothetical protein
LAPADNSTGLDALDLRAARPPGGALQPRWLAFFLPTLPAMLAVASLFYCLFIFDGGRQLFRDSDTGWHIRTGEWILDHRELPRTDPYSFSKPGEPWVAWEWGSDVLMAVAHRFGGLRGVAILFALAVFACTWMCVKLHFSAGGDFLLTGLLAIPMITTSSLHWLARPHVLSWLFLVGQALSLRRAPSPRKLRMQVIWAAAFTALWANIHASFFLAPAVYFLFAVAHLIRPLLWQLDSAEELRTARNYGLLATAAVLGSFINPYGWQLHAHVFQYLRDTDLTSRVAEFQSFNFHDAQATQVALTVLIAALGGVLALSQKKLGHFFLTALLLWGGLRSARVLPLVALLLLPLANGAITQALRGAAELRPQLATALDRLLAYSSGLRTIDRKLNGIVFSSGAVLLMLIAFIPRPVGFPPDRFPVEAARSVANLPSHVRLLAPDSFGGYLIYRFNGTRKVFFDGRSDFYGVDFMKQYLVLSNAKPGWQDIVNKFAFTHALLPKDWALRSALEQSGWRVLHRDQTAVLLEAR